MKHNKAGQSETTKQDNKAGLRRTTQGKAGQKQDTRRTTKQYTRTQEGKQRRTPQGIENSYRNVDRANKSSGQRIKKHRTQDKRQRTQDKEQRT